MLGFVQNYGKVKRCVDHSNAAFDRYFEEFLNGKWDVKPRQDLVSFNECNHIQWSESFRIPPPVITS